jgi:hypothetical protein
MNKIRPYDLLLILTRNAVSTRDRVPDANRISSFKYTSEVMWKLLCVIYKHIFHTLCAKNFFSKKILFLYIKNVFFSNCTMQICAHCGKSPSCASAHIRTAKITYEDNIDNMSNM